LSVGAESISPVLRPVKATRGRVAPGVSTESSAVGFDIYYAKGLRWYRARFPREQMLILGTEDLAADAAAAVL